MKMAHSWFSRLFGKKKRRRVSRVSRVSRKLRTKSKAVPKTRTSKVFVYYDKDDLSVSDYRYHWYAVSAPSKKEAASALRARVSAEVWDRMKGPLPQKEVGAFMTNDAPHEKVTRVKA